MLIKMSLTTKKKKEKYLKKQWLKKNSERNLSTNQIKSAIQGKEKA